MKAPKAQEFPTTKAATTAPVKQKTKAKPSNQNAEKPETVRRSYNLSVNADEKINAVALKMSQKRGKVVSASEALRTIVEAHKVAS